MSTGALSGTVHGCGVRVEGKRDGGGAAVTCGLHQRRQHMLVAEVDAVEVADRNYCRTKVGRHLRKVIPVIHPSSLPADSHP